MGPQFRLCYGPQGPCKPHVRMQYIQFKSNLLSYCIFNSIKLFSFDISFSVEVFDKDTIGKDKSLGIVEVDPRTLDSEPKWFPLQVLYQRLQLKLFFCIHGKFIEEHIYC